MAKDLSLNHDQLSQIKVIRESAEKQIEAVYKPEEIAQVTTAKINHPPFETN